MVKAKFECTRVELYNGGGTVNLQAVTDGSQENESFWKATPSGAITLSIDNMAALVLFKPGMEYYVDFRPAERAAD
jgi:hypothetical protein